MAKSPRKPRAQRAKGVQMAAELAHLGALFLSNCANFGAKCGGKVATQLHGASLQDGSGSGGVRSDRSMRDQLPLVAVE
jgi:hypothetical protein